MYTKYFGEIAQQRGRLGCNYAKVDMFRDQLRNGIPIYDIAKEQQHSPYCIQSKINQLLQKDIEYRPIKEIKESYTMSPVHSFTTITESVMSKIAFLYVILLKTDIFW
jgi:hypothetical protein